MLAVHGEPQNIQPHINPDAHRYIGAWKLQRSKGKQQHGAVSIRSCILAFPRIFRAVVAPDTLSRLVILAFTLLIFDIHLPIMVCETTFELHFIHSWQWFIRCASSNGGTRQGGVGTLAIECWSVSDGTLRCAVIGHFESYLGSLTYTLTSASLRLSPSFLPQWVSMPAVPAPPDLNTYVQVTSIATYWQTGYVLYRILLEFILMIFCWDILPDALIS